MDRMRAALHGGHWPQNPGAANAFFESYHEALFYLLAAGRGIELRCNSRSRAFDAGLCHGRHLRGTVRAENNRFTGGERAYREVAEQALDQRIAAETDASSPASLITRSNGARAATAEHGRGQAPAGSAKARLMCAVNMGQYRYGDLQ